MKYSQFNESQSHYFVSLAPEEILGRLKIKGYLGVAAIAEKEDLKRANLTIEERADAGESEEMLGEVYDTGGEEAVGLMILSFENAKEVSIEWLYVEEAFRGKEVGATLILAACELARDRKMDYVNVRVLENIPDTETQVMMSEYLNLLGFRWQTSLPGDYDIEAGKLKSESFVKSAKNALGRAPGFGALEELTDIEWKKLLNSLSPQDREMLLRVSMDKNIYDPVMSRVKLVKGGLPVGFILIQRVGNTLYPIGLWNRTGERREKMMLILSSVAQLEDAVDDNDHIRLIDRGREMKYFLDALKLRLPKLPVFALKIKPDEYIDSFKTEDIPEPEDDVFFPDTPNDGYVLAAVEKYTDM